VAAGAFAPPSAFSAARVASGRGRSSEQDDEHDEGREHDEAPDHQCSPLDPRGRPAESHRVGDRLALEVLLVTRRVVRADLVEVPALLASAVLRRASDPGASHADSSVAT